MKRFLTIFCAIAFSGAVLSAQNKADASAYMINVGYNRGYRADITNKGARTFANPAIGLDIARFSLKVGYEYQLGCWGHLDGKHMHNVKLGVAYTF
jgi:hypothetical protein